MLQFELYTELQKQQIVIALLIFWAPAQKPSNILIIIVHHFW